MTGFATRAGRRRLALGLSTVLGLKTRGWFVPDRNAGAAREPRTYAALEPLFAAAEADFRTWIAGLDTFAAEFAAMGGPPPAPRFEQGWFPPLDAATAYAMVRLRRPRRIVEIGCGHSTRFLARAVADGGLATTITAIDPAPRADLSALGVHFVRAPMQEAGLAPFEGLEAGDLLLVDSSHVLMPGSDVDIVLGAVLPRLPAGVAVQFHDVFLPDGYPPEWAWRGYNEQQGLYGFLAGGASTLLFASHYARTRLADVVAASVVGRLPRHPQAPDAALWIETG